MDPKKVRKNHRRLFMKAVDKVTKILSEKPVDRDLLETSVAYLCERYKITKLDDDVVTQITEDEAVTDGDAAEEYALAYFDIQRKIKQFMKPASNGGFSNDSVGNDASSCGYSASVRLPKLALPFFDGNILEWLSFWDAFKSAVHDNPNLSDGNKFDYLAAQLQGEPAELISGFQHTKENYAEVVQLLDKTYGDKKRIIRGHIYHIFDLPSPRCTSTDLMAYRNEYESHLRNLKVLSVDVNAASHVYTALLTRKLPLRIRDNINRATRKSYLELQELRTAIDEEIDRLNITDEPDVERRMDTPSEGTVSSFHTTTVNKLSCHYCGQGHKAIDCRTYPTIELRRDIIKSRRLCYNCLIQGHSVNQCRSSKTCTFCNSTHHSSVCYKAHPGNGLQVGAATQSNNSRDTTSSENSKIRHEVERNQVPQTSNATSMNLIRSVTSTILPTAMLGVVSCGSVYYIHTLFDQEAQRSFMLKKTADQLHLQSNGTTEMTINGFNAKGQSKLYEVVRLDTTTNEGYVSINVIVVDSLPGNITMHGRSQVVRDMQFKNISLADPCVEDSIDDIQLIIGADHYFDYVYSEKIDDIALIPSKLGSLISGRTSVNGLDNSTNTSGASIVVTALHIGATDSDQLNTQLSRLWTLDTIGIQHDSLSNEDIAAVEDFESNVTYSGHAYTARLPWKPNHPTLPTNEGLARKRLYGTLSRLRRSPDILQHYDDIMKTHLAKKFIEKIDENSDIPDDAKIHYLPHHEVKKDSATTPIRVVFDCSAKVSSSQASLNDCLLTGPSLVQELGRMLLLFRLHPYAAIADIEKAFLQVGLAESDRDATRFLWPDKPHDPNSKIGTYRFKVVLFGATCSQFLLNATLRHHLGLNKTEVAQKLLERLYVDNLQTSEKSEKSLVDFYNESRRLLKDAGFVLREWHSNSAELADAITQNGDGMALKDGDSTAVPLLGMRWRSDTDDICFASKKAPETDRSFTKRYVISQASKMFDRLVGLRRF